MFGTISSKKIAILGFSFKANTNDTRESPAIYICKKLIEEGAYLKIYDPKVNNAQISIDLNENKSCKWISCQTAYDALEDTDAGVFLTEWSEFEFLDWERISSMMIKPAWIFDTRLIVNIRKVKESGLNIWQVGYGN